MKAIRMAALGMALVVGAATMASAQGGGGGGGGRGGRGGNMAMRGIDSTMTDDQKMKMKAITDKYAPEQAAIREMMATDRDGAMKKRTELTAKMNPELRAILNPAQQAMFDKNLEEQAKMMAMPRPAAPPAL